MERRSRLRSGILVCLTFVPFNLITHGLPAGQERYRAITAAYVLPRTYSQGILINFYIAITVVQ